ncbi:Pycsar system effector family protein [Amaricoccus tamworthensis]|uniref:Pycsar system effector family protein n=1 Tax=Amaricoccus tamworthensis TaxID=57002 RepID=UPI003C7AB8B1
MPQIFSHRDALEANLERQLEAIRASDAKVLLLIPTSSLMVGVLAALLRSRGVDALSAVYVAASIAPIMVAYFFIGMTLIPRTGNGAKGRSLLFFGTISKRSVDEFKSEFMAISEEDYINDLATQCHTVSVIARRKYIHVRNAFLAFFIALPCWGLAIYGLSPAV